MAVEKLMADELLTLIEELGISVYDFAVGNFGYSPDMDDIEFKSPDLQKKHEEAREIANKRCHNQSKEERIRKNDLTRELASAYLEEVGIGDWEEVDQYGGEGRGETWYSIKYFKDHDIYIRTDGWYASYHGTEFDDGYGKEVKPIKKMVTVYE